MLLSPGGSGVFNTKQHCDNVVMTKTPLGSQAVGPSGAPDARDLMLYTHCTFTLLCDLTITFCYNIVYMLDITFIIDGPAINIAVHAFTSWQLVCLLGQLLQIRIFDTSSHR